jgi:hypothetical protein
MSWFSVLRASVDNVCNTAWKIKFDDPLLRVKKEHWDLESEDCVKIGLKKRGQLLGRGVRALTDLVQHEICAVADLAFQGYEYYYGIHTGQVSRDAALLFYVPLIQLVRIGQIAFSFVNPDLFVHVDQGDENLPV